MTLRVEVPAQASAALNWVVSVVFDHFLGIAVERRDGAPGRISIASEGRLLTMPSIFPTTDRGDPAACGAMPTLPLPMLDTAELGTAVPLPAQVPVLFGEATLACTERRIDLGADLFGAIFFMLSRWEEVVSSARDRHDRFQGAESLAFRAGLLERPIVDEWVEVLAALLRRLWPALEFRRREGSIVVSCDVDYPFDPAAASVPRMLRGIGADIRWRRSPALTLRRLRNFVASRRGDRQHDPFYTFDWYADVCERFGRRAAFYFIAENTPGAPDSNYEILDPPIIELMSTLARRGHEIGMHGSYETYRAPERIARERTRLEQAAERARIGTAIEGNRQHFLRWDAKQTADHLDAAGFLYDTTGSFATMAGFRYGTARPFRMWSWRNRAPLRIEQRPLVVMERAILDREGIEPGVERMRRLKAEALRHGGDFTLLWHNSYFDRPALREAFTAIIR